MGAVTQEPLSEVLGRESRLSTSDGGSMLGLKSGPRIFPGGCMLTLGSYKGVNQRTSLAPQQGLFLPWGLDTTPT